MVVRELQLWKQQTVVLSALRGCDGIEKEDTSKALTRAFRSSVLNNADPGVSGRSFMWMDPGLLEKADYFVEHTDHYPVHWVLHFAHACEIVGYKHPNVEARFLWLKIYLGIVTAFHMHPEGEGECDERLRDILVEDLAGSLA